MEEVIARLLFFLMGGWGAGRPGRAGLTVGGLVPPGPWAPPHRQEVQVPAAGPSRLLQPPVWARKPTQGRNQKQNLEHTMNPNTLRGTETNEARLPIRVPFTWHVPGSRVLGRTGQPPQRPAGWGWPHSTCGGWEAPRQVRHFVHKDEEGLLGTSTLGSPSTGSARNTAVPVLF